MRKCKVITIIKHVHVQNNFTMKHQTDNIWATCMLDVLTTQTEN